MDSSVLYVGKTDNSHHNNSCLPSSIFKPASNYKWPKVQNDREREREKAWICSYKERLALLQLIITIDRKQPEMW